MTDLTIALNEYLRKTGLPLGGDWMRKAVRLVLQQLLELEAEQKIGAGNYERAAERTTQRNGYRDRELATRGGARNLRVPKLRQWSFLPSILDPCRRAEKALLAVVQEAYIEGVSTRCDGSGALFRLLIWLPPYRQACIAFGSPWKHMISPTVEALTRYRPAVGAV